MVSRELYNRKAFVLASGGIDSATALRVANTQDPPMQVEGVSVDYDQRHQKEINHAKMQCAEIRAKHSTLVAHDLLRGTMLTERHLEIPDLHYSEIQGVSPTFVPFRNGLLLSIVAAHAQRWIDATIKMRVEALNSRAPVEGKEHYGALGIEEARRVAQTQVQALIFFGAHADDAFNWAYPDCTPEFIAGMANAIFIGTNQKVRLVAPFQYMHKFEIVKLGARLGVDYEQTWSCYAGGALHCGHCPTCYARQEAFEQANIPDPTVYATLRDPA